MNNSRLLRASLAVLVIAGFTAGCDNFEAPEANSVGSESAAARAIEAATQLTKAEVLANLGTETFDGYMAAINEKVPGFGGAYFEDGLLKIAMVGGQSKADQISSVIAELDDGAPDFARTVGAAQVEIVPALYDFASLVAWKEMSNPLMEIGVKLIDADEKTNTVTLGIYDSTIESSVREAAGKIGIPDDALTIEIMNEVKEAGWDLQDYAPYLESGYEIMFGPSDTQKCTMGPIAFRGSFSGAIGGFLLNSHCTAVKGGVDNNPIYQETWAWPGEYIGYEIVDPAWTSGGAGSVSRASDGIDHGMFGPPVGGRPYRLSDAAFADMETSRNTLFGQIAKTRWRNRNSPGDRERVGSFEIVADALNNSQHLVGVELNKVGRSSGWTYGPIARACFTQPDPQDNSRDLKCQYTVDGLGQGGDSGSAVFRITPGTNEVTLYGLLWGRTTFNGVDVPPFYFSTWQAVNSELRYPGMGSQGNLVTH